jgi:hypothetical protein
MTKTMTGGCQCGRVRYEVDVDNDDAYLCHCKMCQRATGGFAAALKGVRKENVRWQGEPDWYDSSPIARRPFCSHCGSPLGFAYKEGKEQMDLTVGSFDDPSALVPVAHYGFESAHRAWLDTAGLKTMRTGDYQPVVDKWVAATGAMPE